VIELQVLLHATADAAALVAQPHEVAHLLGDPLASRRLDLFFPRADLAQPLQAALSPPALVPEEELDVGSFDRRVDPVQLVPAGPPEVLTVRVADPRHPAVPYRLLHRCKAARRELETALPAFVRCADPVAPADPSSALDEPYLPG